MGSSLSFLSPSSLSTLSSLPSTLSSLPSNLYHWYYPPPSFNRQVLQLVIDRSTSPPVLPSCFSSPSHYHSKAMIDLLFSYGITRFHPQCFGSASQLTASNLHFKYRKEDWLLFFDLDLDHVAIQAETLSFLRQGYNVARVSFPHTPAKVRAVLDAIVRDDSLLILDAQSYPYEN